MKPARCYAAAGFRFNRLLSFLQRTSRSRSEALAREHRVSMAVERLSCPSDGTRGRVGSRLKYFTKPARLKAVRLLYFPGNFVQAGMVKTAPFELNW